MDERDAIRTNVKIVQKPMAFAADYVTCNNCACNYSVEGKYPGQFCQIYGRAVDNSTVTINEQIAAACNQWVPVGVNRNKIITPSHTYRYEKEG